MGLGCLSAFTQADLIGIQVGVSETEFVVKLDPAPNIKQAFLIVGAGLTITSIHALLIPVLIIEA